MGPVSRWAVNKPKTAILAWLAMAAGIFFLAANFGGQYNNSFSLPNTESAEAQELLEQVPGAADSLTAATAKVVWQPDEGSATDPAVAQTVSGTLEELAAVPGVSCVVGPYGEPLGQDCPEPQAATAGANNNQGGAQGAGGASDPALAGATAGDANAAQPSAEEAKVLAGMTPAGVSVDGTVAYATVIFAGDAEDLDTADATAVLDAVAAANDTDGLTVGANGQALEFAGQEPPSSEAIGIAVALFILLLAFGSLVGAVLPVLSAVISLGVGLALVQLTANSFDVAEFAPTLAAMIGLGVGIDYALFVINRYKQSLDSGTEPKAAAHEAVRTAGRAVVFAAATVVIALMGLFVLGIDFFNGLAIAAAATVIMMMIGATVLLPAVLSLMGRKAFAIKMPWARKPKPTDLDTGAFARWGSWLQKRYKVVGAAALVVLLVIATPLLSLRLGFTDDSGKPADSSARTAYDLLSEGFGPGVNGPFIVAVQTDNAGDNAAVQEMSAAVKSDPGVAAAIGYPIAPDLNVTAMQVIPTTGPQDEATTQLLDRLRDDVIPAAETTTSAQAFVGGTQAITSDFTSVLVDSLPLFLTVVIGLGFLALVILFRSLLVPLTGAITSLISLAAAMGVTIAVFQWGWAAELIGIAGTGPIAPFLPIMVFAILFGLSMDYQVFLVSRMQEEWSKTGDNRRSIRRGLASSGRVVAIAAAIMFSVFAAFILGNDPTIKLFGLALSTAVLFDAFIVRLIIVPSLMFAFGRANWWLPGWLNRILPEVKVEVEDEVVAEDALTADAATVREPVSGGSS